SAAQYVKDTAAPRARLAETESELAELILQDKPSEKLESAREDAIEQLRAADKAFAEVKKKIEGQIAALQGELDSPSLNISAKGVVQNKLFQLSPIELRMQLEALQNTDAAATQRIARADDFLCQYREAQKKGDKDLFVRIARLEAESAEARRLSGDA